MKKSCFAFAVSIVVCSSVTGFAQSASEPSASDFFCATQDHNESYYAGVPANVWNMYNVPNTGSNFQKLRIGVFFLNGDDAKKELVKEVASEWTKDDAAKGVEWVFDNPNMQHIRIRFGDAGNSWSQIGSAALRSDVKTATMELSLIGDKESNRRTILHEFGHALGLLHEHQNPDSGYIFYTSKIFSDVVSRGWCTNAYGYIGDVSCLKKIEEQITIPVDGSSKCPVSQKFDKDSIMIYTILQSWIFKGEAVMRPKTISNLDKQCVHSLYSGDLSLCRGVEWHDANKVGLPKEVFEGGVAVDAAGASVCRFEANQKFWGLPGANGWFQSKIENNSDDVYLSWQAVLPLCHAISWNDANNAERTIEVIADGIAIDIKRVPICKFKANQKFWISSIERNRHWIRSKVQENEGYVYFTPRYAKG